MFANKNLNDFVFPLSLLITFAFAHRNTKGTHKLSSANKHEIKARAKRKVLTTVENLSHSISGHYLHILLLSEREDVCLIRADCEIFGITLILIFYRRKIPSG